MCIQNTVYLYTVTDVAIIAWDCIEKCRVSG